MLFTAYAIVRTVPSANRPSRRRKKKVVLPDGDMKDSFFFLLSGAAVPKMELPGGPILETIFRCIMDLLYQGCRSATFCSMKRFLCVGWFASLCEL